MRPRRRRFFAALAVALPAVVHAASPPNCGNDWNVGGTVRPFGSAANVCSNWGAFWLANGADRVVSCSATEFDGSIEVHFPGNAGNNGESATRVDCVPGTASPPTGGASSVGTVTVDIGTIDASSASLWWGWGFTVVVLCYLVSACAGGVIAVFRRDR